MLELQSWGIETTDIETNKQLRDAFKGAYKRAFQQRDSLRSELAATVELKALKDEHHNESLH